MAKNDFRINRSNFTIRKKHKSLGDASIYERDYMTTTDPASWYSDVFPYGSSNFKMTIRKNVESTKKHNFGDWLKQSVCVDDENNGDFWTSECLEDTVSPAAVAENNIVLKPDYSSMLDFVYFGNCTEAVRASVYDIIKKYPGELYFSDNSEKYYNEVANDYLYVGGETFRVIENPFEIDVKSDTLSDTVDNPLRYFLLSRGRYSIIDQYGNVMSCITEWSTNSKKLNRCVKEGERLSTIIINGCIRIYEYFANGRTVLMYDLEECPDYVGWRIRPDDKAVDEFFNGLDDFEKLLLNRDSKPLYTATIDYHYDTDEGIKSYKRSFTWPTKNGWNIETSGLRYNEYLNSLIGLASFYDENYTDNVWRMIVHDPIKNMDNSFSIPKSNEDINDYNLGMSRVHSSINVVSRQFDEMKRAIDNIATVNKVTYDGYKNTPDYFLSDSLELSGWDVANPVQTLDSTAEVRAHDTMSKKYTAADAKYEFMRNLKINSKDIFTRKGTREAIEMVLSAFGLCSYDFAKAVCEEKDTVWDDMPKSEQSKLYDYRLDEYVAVAKPNTSDYKVAEDEYLPVERYNELKTSYDENEPSVKGLPVAVVAYNDGETTYRYMVPWFSNVYEIDGNPYFQMYGGWEKVYKKTLGAKKGLTEKDEITESDKFSLYGETAKYLKIVHDINKLSEIDYNALNDGDIVYVFDISDISEYFGEGHTVENSSHYFCIDKKENFTVYGEEEDGWRNISQADIADANGYGLKVLYLENIVDENRGNNPHSGFGHYDDGKAYLDLFRQLFKYSIENDNFKDSAYDCESGEIMDEIRNIGFNVTEQVDNVKCWYFTEPTFIDGSVLPVEKVVDEYSENEIVELGYKVSEDRDNNVLIGEEAEGTLTESRLKAFDYEEEADGGNSEAASYSVINEKKLKLTFQGSFVLDTEFREYLEKCILPYVEQVIPSTTILEVSISGEDTEFACLKEVPIAGISDDDNNKGIII